MKGSGTCCHHSRVGKVQERPRAQTAPKPWAMEAQALFAGAAVSEPGTTWSPPPRAPEFHLCPFQHAYTVKAFRVREPRVGSAWQFLGPPRAQCTSKCQLGSAESTVLRTAALQGLGGRLHRLTTAKTAEPWCHREAGLWLAGSSQEGRRLLQTFYHLLSPLLFLGHNRS